MKGKNYLLGMMALLSLFPERGECQMDHLWSSRFGDASSQFGRSVASDPSGNVFMTGWFYGTVDFGGGPLTSAGGSDIFLAKFGIQTGMAEENSKIYTSLFQLLQNYPNPFSSTTQIRYQIPQTPLPDRPAYRPGRQAGISKGGIEGGFTKGGTMGVSTRLEIYDITGRLVRTFVDGEQEQGYYIVDWDGRDDRGEKAGAGIYFTRFVAGNFNETRKMVLLR